MTDLDEKPIPPAPAGGLDLIIILGTFERRALLEQAIRSIRDAVGSLVYEIVVVDGGSTKDDTRWWLAEQPDVVFFGHRGLRGAVEAYNHAFAYAVDRFAPFIAVMNDDAQIETTKPGALAIAVTSLRKNAELGAVAFAFDLFTHTGWGHDHVYGLPYVNFGVFRREAGMAAARAQGDPSGRRWWNPIYHTYAADCELGVWVWKLGWKIEASMAIHVADKSGRVEDVLRDNNRSRDHLRRDTKLFYERWANEGLVRDRDAQPARPRFTALAPPSVRRILITGGTGFLGQWITSQLRKTFEAMPGVKVCPRERHDQAADTVVLWPVGSRDGDLRDPTAARLLFDRVRPDLVIHAAATVGGIGANVDQPVSMFEDNMRMGMNVMAECVRHPVRRLVLIGTTCSYPSGTPVPFHESRLFDGPPEPTNLPYGTAKRALIELAGAYLRKYGLETVVAIPANLYGEGDTFDDARSHVVAAMVKKFQAARLARTAVELWGTGRPTRDLLHVEDAARGVVAVAQMPIAAGCEVVPIVNLGTGVEVSMAALADTIGNLTGYCGTVTWDASKPDGQPRRALDAARARALGWTPTVSLEAGLKRLIAWTCDG